MLISLTFDYNVSFIPSGHVLFTLMMCDQSLTVVPWVKHGLYSTK